MLIPQRHQHVQGCCSDARVLKFLAQPLASGTPPLQPQSECQVVTPSTLVLNRHGGRKFKKQMRKKKWGEKRLFADRNTVLWHVDAYKKSQVFLLHCFTRVSHSDAAMQHNSEIIKSKQNHTGEERPPGKKEYHAPNIVFFTPFKKK